MKKCMKVRTTKNIYNKYNTNKKYEYSEIKRRIKCKTITLPTQDVKIKKYTVKNKYDNDTKKFMGVRTTKNTYNKINNIKIQ